MHSVNKSNVKSKKKKIFKSIFGEWSQSNPIKNITTHTANHVIDKIQSIGETTTATETGQFEFEFEIESVCVYEISCNARFIQCQSEWNHSITAHEKVHFAANGSTPYQHNEYQKSSVSIRASQRVGQRPFGPPTNIRSSEMR